MFHKTVGLLRTEIYGRSKLLDHDRASSPLKEDLWAPVQSYLISLSVLCAHPSQAPHDCPWACKYSSSTWPASPSARISPCSSQMARWQVDGSVETLILKQNSRPGRGRSSRISPAGPAPCYNRPFAARACLWSSRYQIIVHHLLRVCFYLAFLPERPVAGFSYGPQFAFQPPPIAPSAGISKIALLPQVSLDLAGQLHHLLVKLDKILFGKHI